MTWRGQTRRALGVGAALPRAGLSHILSGSARAPRFAGAWRTRDEAEAARDALGSGGYDDEGIADVSFDLMCARAAWDYPILFWLGRLLPNHPVVIDAGGHMGTKYIAFSGVLDLSAVRWTVFDLPGIVCAARQRQADGTLPAAIAFEDKLEAAPPGDILLGSGLLQYLSMPFTDFVETMRQRPKFILLNKVALRDGLGVFTIERIGRNRVLYQIRNRTGWEAEIANMGYEILDTWPIPELGHVIPTHPWLGRSESRGYALQRRD